MLITFDVLIGLVEQAITVFDDPRYLLTTLLFFQFLIYTHDFLYEK